MHTEDKPVSEEHNSTSDVIRAHVLVSGHVQGVAFRAFAQHQAMHLNLHGWVRNLSDGQVESEVEGPRASVDAFLVSLRQGPPLAQVEEVRVKWIAVTNDLQEFCIVRS